MKSHPLLMSASMVRAILAGRKTQTRRLQGLEEINVESDRWHDPFRLGLDWLFEEGFKYKDPMSPISYRAIVKTKYQPRDEIWVRETYALIDNEDGRPPWVQYRADTDGECRPGGWPDATPDEFQSDPSIPKWKPSIFMRREHSRITLRVVRERIERLHDITEADAIAEGIEAFTFDVPPEPPGQTQTKYGLIRYFPQTEATPQLAYKALWNAINKKAPWKTNPWVRVIEFEVVR